MEEVSYENDPGRWGASLVNVKEILRACLDARGARSVLEVGAYAGDLTHELLDWAADTGATVTAIDPEPMAELRAVADQHPELTIVPETSHEALRHVPLPDAVIIDGDHNYHTVSEELRLIDERAAGDELPLLLFHDVGWPHARRDSYYAPDRIPEADRQPMVERGGIAPDEPGLTDRGLPLPWVAEREGGERNGVLTAIEDFIADRDRLRLAALPLFFGFGVLWDDGADWAPAIAATVSAWDRNPVLQRLEGNRVYHLAIEHQLYIEVMELRDRVARQDALLAERERLLNTMLDSRAFGVAEQLSRLRQRGRPAISRKSVRAALDRDQPA